MDQENGFQMWCSSVSDPEDHDERVEGHVEPVSMRGVVPALRRKVGKQHVKGTTCKSPRDITKEDDRGKGKGKQAEEGQVRS